MNIQYAVEMVTRTEAKLTMPDGSMATISDTQAISLINNMAAKGIHGALILRNGREGNRYVVDAALKAAKLEGFQAARAMASGRIEF